MSMQQVDMRDLCRTTIHDVKVDAWYSQIDPIAIQVPH